MAAKRVAGFVAGIAILAAVLFKYFNVLFVQFGGLFHQIGPPILHHSALSQIFSSLGNPSEAGEKLFTIEELSSFTGEPGSSGLYLSILGRVYDVQKGKKHYGPGGSYHGFAGRDASASFATGDFTATGLTQNVLTLSDAEVKSVWDWIALYDREYQYKGKLIGQFYDRNGEPTLDYHSVLEIVKNAEKVNQSKQADKIKFPPCNMEWSAQSGSRVWCSRKSGGIERDWVGVPRKYYEIGADTHRCACVPLELTSQSASKGMIQEYETCRPDAESCFIKPDK